MASAASTGNRETNDSTVAAPTGSVASSRTTARRSAGLTPAGSRTEPIPWVWKRMRTSLPPGRPCGSGVPSMIIPFTSIEMVAPDGSTAA